MQTVTQAVEAEIHAFRTMCAAEGLPIETTVETRQRPGKETMIVATVVSPAGAEWSGFPLDQPGSAARPWLRMRFRESLDAYREFARGAAKARSEAS